MSKGLSSLTRLGTKINEIETVLRLTHSCDGHDLAVPVILDKSRCMWISGVTCHQPTLVAKGLGCTVAMLDWEGHSSITHNDGAKPLIGAVLFQSR